MRVRGIPAALVAITATLTLVPTVQHHSTVRPQARPQIVDTAATTPRLDWIDRASRSRPLPAKTASTQKTLTPIPVRHVIKTAPARSTQPRTKIRTQNVRAFVPRGTSAEGWANSTDGIKVANCESGDRHSWDHYNGNPHLRDNSRYRGKWQMGFSEWRGTGGSGDPADASESEQDYRAHLLFLARGWQPWSCSRIMGVG